MYRVYWANTDGNLDFIDVSILFTAKQIFYVLTQCSLFRNSIKNYGGLKIYMNNQWSEWVDKNKKTIRELFELDEKTNFNQIS